MPKPKQGTGSSQGRKARAIQVKGSKAGSPCLTYHLPSSLLQRCTALILTFTSFLKGLREMPMTFPPLNHAKKKKKKHLSWHRLWASHEGPLVIPPTAHPHPMPSAHLSPREGWTLLPGGLKQQPQQFSPWLLFSNTRIIPSLGKNRAKRS